MTMTTIWQDFEHCAAIIVLLQLAAAIGSLWFIVGMKRQPRDPQDVMDEYEDMIRSTDGLGNVRHFRR